MKRPTLPRRFRHTNGKLLFTDDLFEWLKLNHPGLPFTEVLAIYLPHQVSADHSSWEGDNYGLLRLSTGIWYTFYREHPVVLFELVTDAVAFRLRYEGPMSIAV